MGLVTSATLLESGNTRVKAGRHGLMAFNVHDTFVDRSMAMSRTAETRRAASVPSGS
jgi:hypothetical protein